LFGLSVLSTIICAYAAAAHYLKSPWGDVWQPIGWLLGILFLLLAVLPNRRELAASLKMLITPKTAFFLFWILFFVASHFWYFRTAPWNGDALFDESGWDLWYLKTYVIGHVYQPAWFHPPISRETLFHYYVWGFLKLFGFNILSYEAALFVIWLTIFVFTLLLVDLFFESFVVTSVAALVLNFLPFAFIYTFAGYRYPMATALAVMSLFFLHLGFRASSRFYLSLSGITAGLCLASSISGKQYLLALVIAAPVYAAFYWRCLTQAITWKLVAIALYGFLVASTPILLYIIFNRQAYTLYESSFVREFWQAVKTGPFPSGIRPYIEQCRSCFFSVPALRFFIPDTLPIPLPYYFFLVPGLALSVWQKRFEIPLLAIIPVVGAFVAKCIDNRLLMPIPFWIILMSFTFAAVLQLRRWLGVQIVIGVLATLILLNGLIPSIRYIYGKAKSPFSIRYYAQHEVAVSRFLRHVVAGQEHPEHPRLERDEFNRIKGIPDAPYDTLICQNEAYSIIHLFLRDYDDNKVLSLCSGLPFFWVMTEQDVWNANKRAILTYTPSQKDLKLIWERDPKTEPIINMFSTVSDLGTEDALSLSSGGRLRRFYVLNIPNKNIREFQDRVSGFSATPGLNSSPVTPPTMFEGGKGRGKGQFDSPNAMAIDGNGNVFIADTGNGRIEQFSSTGAFVNIIKIAGSDRGQSPGLSGIAIDHAGNIYVADASRHSVEKLSPDGMLMNEWKGPDPGFYGPRRIAIGPDNSIYVVDQGRTRIVRFSPDGRLLSLWGSKGTGDGQFDDPTSVGVDPKTSKVYVADPQNKRIQVFDSEGKFLSNWRVPEWGQRLGYEDLVIDSEGDRLYASSANMNAILVFDLSGARIGSLTPKPPGHLEGPSALALVDGKLYILNMAGNRVSVIDL
jgi:DNA-binding beta-propeller fold protein YncE